VHTQEPPQKSQRRFSLPGDSQPIFGVAFHRPPVTHRDDDALAVLGTILGEGRTSRLNVRMVKQDKSALAVGTIDGFPGDKYPGLMLVFAVPNQGRTPEEMEKVTLGEIERLRTDLVTPEELARVKTETRADFIRGLASNAGLAAQLAVFEARRGGWRKLFDEVAQIEAVTAEQVREVAQRYLVLENSTVGYMVTEGGSDKGAQGQ